MTPKQILSLRQKIGMTQTAFATLFGVTAAAVCHWETGKRKPSRPILILLKNIRQKKDLPILADGKARKPKDNPYRIRKRHALDS